MTINRSNNRNNTARTRQTTCLQQLSDRYFDRTKTETCVRQWRGLGIFLDKKFSIQIIETIKTEETVAKTVENLLQGATYYSNTQITEPQTGHIN